MMRYPMSDWTLMKQLPKAFEAASQLPPGVFSAIATRIEDAIADGSREHLIEMQDQLSGLLKLYASRSGDEVIGALQGSASPDSAAATAYALGQINFAQLLTAQAGTRRVEAAFAMLVEDHGDIVRMLLSRNMTGLELAEATGFRPETVSRKLKVMREAGISDYYREGTSLYNFLTPAAKALAPDLQSADEPRHGGVAVRRAIVSRQSSLQLHMRHALTFAPNPPSETASARVGL